MHFFNLKNRFSFVGKQISKRIKRNLYKMRYFSSYFSLGLPFVIRAFQCSIVTAVEKYKFCEISLLHYFSITFNFLLWFISRFVFVFFRSCHFISLRCRPDLRSQTNNDKYQLTNHFCWAHSVFAFSLICKSNDSTVGSDSLKLRILFCLHLHFYFVRMDFFVAVFHFCSHSIHRFFFIPFSLFSEFLFIFKLFFMIFHLFHLLWKLMFWVSLQISQTKKHIKIDCNCEPVGSSVPLLIEHYKLPLWWTANSQHRGKHLCNCTINCIHTWFHTLKPFTNTNIHSHIHIGIVLITDKRHKQKISFKECHKFLRFIVWIIYERMQCIGENGKEDLVSIHFRSHCMQN